MSAKDSSRTKKLYFNMGSSMLYQVLATFASLILPRLFLVYFGSATNGLVNSITQLLSYISLMDLGVGAVFQSALYEPLAQKDYKRISNIFASGRQFYKKIGIIIGVYILILSVVFPFAVSDNFDYLPTMLLVLAMAISMFAQYFLGLAYQVFLSADQHHYIQSLINSATLVLNTVVSIVLIVNGSSIQVVKFTTSCIFLFRPLLMKWYVDKNYNIDYSVKPTKDAIPQKWNGFAQHVAAVVLNNTDVVVLTFFSTLTNVSIYSVYYMAVSAIKQLINIITSAIEPTLGNIYGLKEGNFESTFSFLEWVIHCITILLFTITAILITPFALTYTLGIHDADYNQPVFGILISAAFAMTCLQLPYIITVKVVGHYKQTQMSSIIEALINIVVSIAMVFRFGLIGVAIGTFAAMAYRMVYLELYVYRRIVQKPESKFIKQIALDGLSVAVMYIATKWVKLTSYSFGKWIMMAIIVGIICLVCSAAINFVFQRPMCRVLVNSKLFSRFKKKSKQ